MANLGCERSRPPIEADSDTATGESDDPGFSTDYESIVSTISSYVYQNGRRYHSYQSSKYLLPNDEREQERLNFIHQLFRLTLDGALCYTNLENPQRILDVGTGSGIWALDIAEEFPSAEVIGTDLSPVRPPWTPPNVEFVVEDALQEWAFPESYFDFIHIRQLAGGVPDWLSLLKQCYKALKPGGQIEVSDNRGHVCCDDDSYPADSQLRNWSTEFVRIAQQIGLEFDVFLKLDGWMREAGFTDLENMEEVIPIGSWPKDRKLKLLGYHYLAQCLDVALDSYTVKLFTQIGGWKLEDVQTLLTAIKKELKSNKMHVYTHFSFAVGRKPG